MHFKMEAMLSSAEEYWQDKGDEGMEGTIRLSKMEVAYNDSYFVGEV